VVEGVLGVEVEVLKEEGFEGVHVVFDDGF